MNILVLNGSPKGKYSITLQTVRYLEKLCPRHTFEVLHVGQRIKALEKDFSDAAQALARADLIVFSYPVYTFIAPYQMHRFIELIKESGIALVIAKDFARIFYRNAINIGLPIVECPEAVDAIENGHTVCADLDRGVIQNLTTGEEFPTHPFPPFINDIIQNGGLVECIRRGVIR